MFHSTHTRRRASTAVITTVAVIAFLAIGRADTDRAQSAAHETLTHVIAGIGGSRVTVPPAGPTASRTATAEGPTALQGPNASTYGAPKEMALVGSWLETVTFPSESGRPPLKSLVSFHDAGIMTYSDQGNVTTEPPTIFSSGHGAWTHLEKHTFAYTSLGLISDLSGNLVGYLKVRGVYTVSQSGNEYNGTSFAKVLDTDGNVLFSVEVTNAGQRIKVELP
jgi:hypothetical protein